MIKALIKKQMLELLASLFRNRKNKRTDSKGMIVLLLVLFVIIAASFGVAFFGMAEMMYAGLQPQGMLWLSFAFFGVLAFGLGLIGSVFMTYTTLYASKDNDLLLSMPIKPTYILIARTLGLYLLTLIFEALVLVPVEIQYIFRSGFHILQFLFALLTVFLLPLFTFVFSALFGYIVALIAPKVKNKSAASVILAVIFFVIYFFLYFRFSEIMKLLVSNASSVADVMKYGFFPFYAMGCGLSGQYLWYLLFALIAAALFALVYLLLQHSFIRLATTPAATARREYHGEIGRQFSPARALLRKEMGRFFSCPSYILNTFIGVLFVLAATVMFFVNRSTVLLLRDQIGAGVTAVALAAGVSLLAGLSSTTAPSISLEGQSFPILRSLPVSSRAILHAKIKLHLLMIALPAAVCHIVMSVSLFADRPTVAILCALAPLPLLHLSGVFGLVYNLKSPYFDWANEAVAVKQSMSVLFTMLSMMGVSMLCSAVGVLMILILEVPAEAALAAVIAIGLLFDGGFTLLLEKWGTKKIETL